MPDVAVSRAPRALSVASGRGCGGSWSWRLQLKKRAINKESSRSMMGDSGCRSTHAVARFPCKPRVVAGRNDVSSRASSAYAWWSAVRSFQHGVAACKDDAEALQLLAVADPRVVRYRALGLAGLRCRFVGGARVRMIRPSSGCGVHRRKQHAGRCAGRLAKCARSGRTLGEHPVSIGVVDCGSQWHGLKAKCLQACVASLFRGAQRDRVERRFWLECHNHAGSGCAGARAERRNLEAVQRILEEERVYINVLESSCAGSLANGTVTGVWQLG